MSRNYLALSGLLLSLCGAVANAADTETGFNNRWLLAKYDTNGDQVISMEEIGVKRQKLFHYMDGDADGAVTLDEYESVDAQKRRVVLQARFAKLDLDRDGQLSAEEYASYLGSFDRFDQDGDGNVSSSEMAGEQRLSNVTAAAKDSDSLCLLWLCVRPSLD